MEKDSMQWDKLNLETRMLHCARADQALGGIINPPIEQASTILHTDLKEFDNPASKKFIYGRRGTNTALALREAISELEGAYDTVLCSSGTNAIITTLQSLTKHGSHILISDNVYGPTRKFCNEVLHRFGVEVEYYPPLLNEKISTLIKPNTALIFMESPGSLTFEVQNVSAIAQAAKDAGIFSVIDNTWSGGLLFPALKKGVDISIQSIAKYIGGHSDIIMGSIACGNKRSFEKVWEEFDRTGVSIGASDIYLALRGMRTLSVRLEKHDCTTRKVVSWLQECPKVKKILHPMISSHPGHLYWKEHFKGASGLFGFTMEKVTRPVLAKMLDHMRLFAMGYGWGGYESLIIPVDPIKNRTASTWNDDVQTMRLNIGLEHPDDLIQDLADGFLRLKS